MDQEALKSTIAAMKAAPRNAYYVWRDQHVQVAQAIAAEIGRSDLEFVGRTWLELTGNVVQHDGREIVVDPSTALSPKQQAMLKSRQKPL
jgi:hypothetical protein